MSYWWTEDIYATAFGVLCFPPNKIHNETIDKAITYLSDKQKENGSWENGNIESSFYTAISLKALIHYYLTATNANTIKKRIQKGINWLLKNQMSDGSWDTTRILRIPSPEITNPQKIKNWGNTSFGLNCLVDDHNRIFTTSTAFNALSIYAKHLKK